MTKDLTEGKIYQGQRSHVFKASDKSPVLQGKKIYHIPVDRTEHCSVSLLADQRVGVDTHWLAPADLLVLRTCRIIGELLGCLYGGVYERRVSAGS